MQSAEFVERLHQARATAILRTDDATAVAPAMTAAVEAGFRVIEFTLTTPDAYRHIEAFSRRGDLVVGAGTVLTVDEARKAVAAGAKFLVSPVVDPAVIEAAAALGVAAIPGCHTPTELLAAHRAGAPLQKLFPAPASGPSYVRACLGPLPFLRIVPTNGVDANNARAWLDAGAWAVGFVNPLFDPAAMAARRFDEIGRRARELLAAVAN